jgi:hypothetical protein
MGSSKPTSMNRAAVSPIAEDGVGIDQAGGHNRYFTWWSDGNGIVEEGLTVQPHDMITATVTQNNGMYTFNVVDSTHPQTGFPVGPVNCPGCAATSAEWVVQAVPHGTGFYKLTNFGHWPISQANWQTTTSASGNIAALPHVAIFMERPVPKVLVQPLALQAGGSAFINWWKHGN